MKTVFAAMLILTASPLAAQTLAPISPHQALANRDQCVAVQGLASVRADPQRSGIDVDLDGKNSGAFGYIEHGNGRAFPNINSVAGHQVKITGVVEFYQGRAQIKMVSAKQLSPPTSEDAPGLTHLSPTFLQGGSFGTCGD